MASVRVDTQRGNGARRRGAGEARPQEGDGPAADLTIEQLAAEVGMSVRNIRNHHSRGLLPAPERALSALQGPSAKTLLAKLSDVAASLTFMSAASGRIELLGDAEASVDRRRGRAPVCV